MADLGTDTSLKVALSEIEKKVGQSEVDRNTLRTNLINKGIDVANVDKMSGLVNKIPKLKVLPTVMTKGDTWTIYSGYENKTTGYEWKIAQSYYFSYPGSYKCDTKYRLMYGASGGLFGNIRIDYKRNGQVLSSKQATTTSQSDTSLIIEYDDVKQGDWLEVYVCNNDNINFTNYFIFTLQIKCRLSLSDFK